MGNKATTKHIIYSDKVPNSETEEYYSIYKSFTPPEPIKENNL